MISGRMPNLVKGAGFAKVGGNQPLTDDAEIFKRSYEAERALRTSVKNSMVSPDTVRKSINPAFSSQFGLFLSDNGGGSGYGQLASEISSVLSAELGKNITIGNGTTTGSPLGSGFVPFDLVAPSRLIYPVYSPLRNKVPRVAGQGTSHRAKLVTGISGSQTGSGSTGNAQRVSISELGSGSSVGGSNWPMNIPASGNQSAVDMNIPYQFFGMSESLSWLAQFAGQGFEDVSALANLVLLQEFMLAEEYSMLSGTSSALATPSAPTLSARTAGTVETPITNASTNVFVRVSALNYYGETLASTGASIGCTTSQVVDVKIAPVRGAFTYNIYTTTGSTAGTYYLTKSGQGATTVTIQGALPTSGTSPLATATSTSSSTDYEGWLSVVDGHGSIDASVYPSGFTGSYINKSANSKLNHSILFNALDAMWNGSGVNNASSTGGFRADPAELVAEGSDIARLADEVIASGANTNYRLFLSPDEVGGVRSGAAVSEIQNPITRSILRVVVHPWLTQGTAFLNSYTLPMSWSNVSNVWENVMVQDYLSINWPVIDASFRYSIYMYGALVNYAPQYNGVIQGLQQSTQAADGTNA